LAPEIVLVAAALRAYEPFPLIAKLINRK